MQRFRAALLALGLLLSAASVGAAVLVEKAGDELDNDLRLDAASSLAAIDDFVERAEAVTLVASHSAAFTSFYRARGTLEERISGRTGDEFLMPAVHTALADVGLLFRDSLAAAGFVDRSGAENAVVVRGRAADPEDLSPDRRALPFFYPAFVLPFGEVYQSAPYRSAATGEWVVSTATKVDTGPGVAPAIVHFEFTIESFRLALYSEHPGVRVRAVDTATGDVVIDSTKPQDMVETLGDPSDRSLEWAATAADGDLTSHAGMRHVVRLTRTGAHAGNPWALVISVAERSGPWAGPTSAGPLTMLAAGTLLLALSVLGYAGHGRSMHRIARRDELTGLHNRMAAREAAEALLSKERSLAVILFDLDRFKYVNDSLGHHAGDHLLTVIAQRLADVVREPDDVVARLGGDEFVVLARDVRDEESARVLCDRLTRAVETPVRVDGLDVSVGVSLGIAMAPGHGDDYGTLLQRADIAMYDAKARRAGWQIYHEDLATSDRAELTMDSDLRRAIVDGELEVAFQPSYDIRTGAPTRVEALVRWRHPVEGLRQPAEFVPFAETTGSTKLVTRAVLIMALDQVVAWRAAGEDVTVAVNVSAHDVKDQSFADLVSGELAARGLPGSSLTVELTEKVLLDDPATAGAVLGRLVASGVTVAIDDFGAGYASLLYLRRFPVSMLKLDPALVHGLVAGGTDAALLHWTVEMAHSLGVRCVAEGVEDAQTLAALVDLGCDEVQGYFLQVPCAADELDLSTSTIVTTATVV